jgi:hypothetical protein
LPSRDLIAWVPAARDERLASVRLRTLLPVQYLADAGWRVELFREERVDDYSLVVFQKAYDTAALGLAERLADRGARLALDVCDNHFYNPLGLPEIDARAERLKRMLGLVDSVSVSAEPLRDLLPQLDAPVIDDALDEVEPPRRLWPRRGGCLRLVWYGNAGSESPPFGLVHVPPLVDLLNELRHALPLELTVISNSRERYAAAVADALFPTRYLEWTRDSFVRQFVAHDVCVIPIERNPFTICKTANRVALSLRLGVPVVADRIPSFEPFEPFIRLDDWAEGLIAYGRDAELRCSDAARGRAYVLETYTRDRVVAQWGAFLGATLVR